MFNRGFSIATAILNFAAIRSAQMPHTAGLMGLATAPPDGLPSGAGLLPPS